MLPTLELQEEVTFLQCQEHTSTNAKGVTRLGPCEDKLFISSIQGIYMGIWGEKGERGSAPQCNRERFNLSHKQVINTTNRAGNLLHFCCGEDGDRKSKW